MMMRKAIWLSVVVSVVAVSDGWAQGLDRGTCRELARTFFANPQQREVDFKTLDIDTQFTIYVCAVQYMHPPLIEFADWFALGGPPVAHYLRERLSRPLDDETTRDIVLVFALMTLRRTYDVTSDAPLVRLLERRVNSIVDADIRAHAQMLLNRVWISRP